MTTESLIVANTPTSDTAQSAAATTETTTPAVTAPAATAAPEQQSSADTTTNAPAEKAADGTDSAEAPKSTAPEKYEIKAPEGVELNATVMGEFEGVAKELGLSQDDAQTFVSKMAPQIAAAQKAQLETIKAQWTESSRTDKEFGGDKLTENIAVAEKALDAFGTPDLRKLLKETGLANHPEIIRVFYKAGQKISSSNFVAGGGNSDAIKGAAATLYPNQSSKG